MKKFVYGNTPAMLKQEINEDLSLIHISANLKNPLVCKEIIEELPTQMQKLGIQSLNEIIGGAL